MTVDDSNDMLPLLTDAEIVAARGPRNQIRTDRPYHFLVEAEYAASGTVEDVATIFLSNRECPLRCLMCDLWKNTTRQKVDQGAIPAQIRFALDRLPPARHVKLYNSGNFFDHQAIPREDHAEIADLVSCFDSVIVENHPNLAIQRAVDFQTICGTQLEVAMGLETAHEATLRRLNKRMTAQDFANACDFLRRNQIRIRTFVLLRPPGLSEDEGIRQALDSVRFAFDCGVDCCAVIPTRGGNGILEQLQARGQFMSPQLTSLESVVAECLAWQRGRVFADLWDAEPFSSCHVCTDQRIERLRTMNLTQTVADRIFCADCDSGASGG